MPCVLPGFLNYTFPFRHRKKVYIVNPQDVTHRVVYLGNVLILMARGDGCADKALEALWSAHCNRTNETSDVAMRLTATRAGLTADTDRQGLTEYWSHRITYCFAPIKYPRVFCWIYKHEGELMKPELRCHAVLCRRRAVAMGLPTKLNEHIQSALTEYKRERLSMQRRRHTLVATGRCAQTLPAVEGKDGLPVSSTSPGRKAPRRQTMYVNRNRQIYHYRPPRARSRSAPRLDSIDEDAEDEEEEKRRDMDDRISRTLSVPLENDLPSVRSVLPAITLNAPSRVKSDSVPVAADQHTDSTAALRHDLAASHVIADGKGVLRVQLGLLHISKGEHSHEPSQPEDTSAPTNTALHTDTNHSPPPQSERQSTRHRYDVGYLSFTGRTCSTEDDDWPEASSGGESLAGSSGESGYHEHSERSSLEEGDQEYLLGEEMCCPQQKSVPTKPGTLVAEFYDDSPVTAL